MRGKISKNEALRPIYMYGKGRATTKPLLIYASEFSLHRENNYILIIQITDLSLFQALK